MNILHHCVPVTRDCNCLLPFLLSNDFDLFFLLDKVDKLSIKVRCFLTIDYSATELSFSKIFPLHMLSLRISLSCFRSLLAYLGQRFEFENNTRVRRVQVPDTLEWGVTLFLKPGSSFRDLDLIQVGERQKRLDSVLFLASCGGGFSFVSLQFSVPVLPPLSVYLQLGNSISTILCLCTSSTLCLCISTTLCLCIPLSISIYIPPGSFFVYQPLCL